MSPDGKTHTTIADDELINPTGLEIGADGDIYISNKGFVDGQGEVLRLSLEQDTTCDRASLDDSMEYYMMGISASHNFKEASAVSDLANVYDPLLNHSVSIQPYSEV